MAPAAFATLRAHFDDLHCAPEDYDAIITGDLGRLGSEILHGLLEKDGIRADVQDCGVMIFDAQRQDVHCGGSGCGCSASVLCGPLLSRMERGELRREVSVDELVRAFAVWERAQLYDWCLCGGDYSLVAYAEKMTPLFLESFRVGE